MNTASKFENKLISKLHYLTQDLAERSHAELAEIACKEGVRWIQFRMKDALPDERREEAKAVKQVCRKYGATFIVNDAVHLAYELEADGVHLGREDMPWKEARNILGEAAIIGGTANNHEQALSLLGEPIDYIGLGPYRFTDTKQKIAPLLGREGTEKIIQALRNAGSIIPVIVIGGILAEDVSNIISVGAHGVAVSSAIGRSNSPELAAQELVSCF